MAVPDSVGSSTFTLDFAFFLTEAVVSSGRVEKSPHEQEIKFFAKVNYFKLHCVEHELYVAMTI